MNTADLKLYRMKPNAVVGGLPWWTEAGEYLGRELQSDVRTVELWAPDGAGSVEVLRCSVLEVEDRQAPAPRVSPRLRRAGMMMSAAALLAILLPALAQAETASAPRCRTASFETCGATGHSASIVAIARGAANLPAVRFTMPEHWEVVGMADHPIGWIPDCDMPHHAHVQCPALEEPPVSVTPEPVTMTLLATGLAGMGMAGLRRRKPPLA